MMTGLQGAMLPVRLKNESCAKDEDGMRLEEGREPQKAKLWGQGGTKSDWEPNVWIWTSLLSSAP